jgi:tetratricopeptide (TPR) repeat protein
MAENKDVRAAQERIRAQAYESGGPKAVKAAEKHIKAEAYAKAIPLLVKLDKAFPNEPELLNWLGFTHRKLKDYPVAKVFYDRALKIDPLYKPALEYQGMWFIEMGDIPSAKANLERLRKICAACEETKDLEDALKQAGH